MRIAFILYDNVTLLDFIGFYGPISRLKSGNYIPDFEWDVCAMTSEIIDGFKLKIMVDKVQPDLSKYDLIFIAGGFGSRKLQYDKSFISWLKTAYGVSYKTSVCTGSSLLGSAGFLEDKKATTHFNEYANLSEYGCEVIKSDLVEDGNVVTAGAVASSIPLGLFWCRKLAGYQAEQEIREKMNYHCK